MKQDQAVQVAALLARQYPHIHIQEVNGGVLVRCTRNGPMVGRRTHWTYIDEQSVENALSMAYAFVATCQSQPARKR